MPLESLQFHAGWRQPKESHAAIDRADDGIHTLVAKHATEVDHKVIQLQVVIDEDLQHPIHGLIKQAALDGVVVVLQEGTDKFVRFFELLQGEMNEQL